MKSKKITLSVNGPILSGSVYKSEIKCGKNNCHCKDGKKLHVIYQWSGNIDGKNTSRGLTIEMFEECQIRIENYKKLRNQFNEAVEFALKNAPWINK